MPKERVGWFTPPEGWVRTYYGLDRWTDKKPIYSKTIKEKKKMSTKPINYPAVKPKPKITTSAMKSNESLSESSTLTQSKRSREDTELLQANKRVTLAVPQEEVESLEQHLQQEETEAPVSLEMQVAEVYRDTAPQGSAHGSDMRDPEWIAENFSGALAAMENADIQKIYLADNPQSLNRLRMRVTALAWYLEEQYSSTRKWGYVSSAKTNVTYPKDQPTEKKIKGISGFFHKDMNKGNNKSGDLSNGVPQGSFLRR